MIKTVTLPAGGGLCLRVKCHGKWDDFRKTALEISTICICFYLLFLINVCNVRQAQFWSRGDLLNCLFHRTFLCPGPVNLSVSQKNIEQALYVLQCCSEKMEWNQIVEGGERNKKVFCCRRAVEAYNTFRHFSIMLYCTIVADWGQLLPSRKLRISKLKHIIKWYFFQYETSCPWLNACNQHIKNVSILFWLVWLCIQSGG